MITNNILTRREFLQKGLVFAATSVTVPSSLLRTI
jgi:hypothetical protein